VRVGLQSLLDLRVQLRELHAAPARRPRSGAPSGPRPARRRR
jgi:hypothetical protein